jgi:hypothetical protein
MLQLCVVSINPGVVENSDLDYTACCNVVVRMSCMKRGTGGTHWTPLADAFVT